MTEKQNNASSTTTIPATQLNSTDLLIAEADSNLTISSMEVAEMMNKEHYHVIRDIRKYVKYLDFEAPEDSEDISISNKLNSADFFIESYYIDSQGKKQACFKVTKKGLDFLARKLTGQKGAKFTARYINRFYELEKLNKIQNVLDSMKFLVDTISEIQTELHKMQQLIATQNAAVNCYTVITTTNN